MKNIPHAFVLDLLFEKQPIVKSMFGVKSVYLGDLLVLALRDNPDKPSDNGVWIGTEVQYHESLKEEIPSLTHLRHVPIKKWLLIPVGAAHFEEDVTKVCELIIQGDPRIGVLKKKK